MYRMYNVKIKQFARLISNLIYFHLTVKVRPFFYVKTHNALMIDKTSKVLNSSIIFRGRDNIITIKENCNICGLHILVIGSGNVIDIGKGVTINASRLQPTVINVVGGSKIRIGDFSLLSNNIEIHTSDYHGIYDLTGERINKEKDILIGKRVWIGLGTKILKGAEIGSGCVVGAGSILSRKYNMTNTILAGCPANIIKQDVIWDHGRQDKLSSKELSRRYEIEVNQNKTT